MSVYGMNTPGDVGRRVRFTTVGFELPFITQQLSMMDLLEGGTQCRYTRGGV